MKFFEEYNNFIVKKLSLFKIFQIIVMRQKASDNENTRKYIISSVYLLIPKHVKVDIYFHIKVRMLSMPHFV